MSKFTPHKLREVALQMLCALDLGSEGEGVCALLKDEMGLSTHEIEQAYEVAQAVRETLAVIDQRLSTLSDKYSFEQIAFLDRNILRLALYELMIGKLPAAVVISEAIRLARKFSRHESGSFINALLDKHGASLSA